MAANKDRVERRPSAKHGEGLFATEDIAAGERIFLKERPYIALLDGPRLQDTCANCFIRASNPMDEEQVEVKACMQCKSVKYCGKKCQSESWKRIHKSECKNLVEATNTGKRVLPTMVRSCMQILTRLASSSVSPTELADIEGLNSHIQALKASNPELKEEIELFSFTALGYSGTIKKHTPRFAQEVFAKNLVNALTLTNEFFEPFGLVFDPFLARANHSCAPNVYVIFDGAEMSLRSLVPIAKDEEVLISYVDPTQSYSFRQGELRSRYQFTCVCVKCTQGDNGPESTFTGDASQVPKAIAEKASTFLKQNPKIQNEPKHALAFANTTNNSPLPAALEALLETNHKKAVNDNLSPDEIITLLTQSLALAKASKIYPQTRQPVPSLRHELFTALPHVGDMLGAFKQGLYLYFNVWPVLYPSTHHPIRVIRNFTLFSIVNYLPAMLTFDAQLAALDLDWWVVVYGIIVEVADNVGRSHGAEHSLAKMVARKKGEVLADMKRADGWEDAGGLKGVKGRMEETWRRLRAIAKEVE